jgi:predicted RecA/RadA family phage recombinase
MWRTGLILLRAGEAESICTSGVFVWPQSEKANMYLGLPSYFQYVHKNA